MNDSLLEDLKFNKKNNMQQIYDTIMSEVNIDDDHSSQILNEEESS